MLENISYISYGIFLTLALLAGGVMIGSILGLLLAVLRYNQHLTAVIKFYVSIVRGTPLILQLSFIYFLLPGLIGCQISILTAGFISFGINSSAYIAEIIRSGIESIGRGQFEAAKSLKIPGFYLWKDIIIPQVLRNVFPALTNEIIALLKETALISTIGGLDILRRAQSVAAEQFTYFIPFCIAGCCYYFLVIIIEFIAKKIEKRLNYVACT